MKSFLYILLFSLLSQIESFPIFHVKKNSREGQRIFQNIEQVEKKAVIERDQLLADFSKEQKMQTEEKNYIRTVTRTNKEESTHWEPVEFLEWPSSNTVNLSQQINEKDIGLKLLEEEEARMNDEFLKERMYINSENEEELEPESLRSRISSQPKLRGHRFN